MPGGGGTGSSGRVFLGPVAHPACKMSNIFTYNLRISYKNKYKKQSRGQTKQRRKRYRKAY
jgi:hypothetical protein